VSAVAELARLEARRYVRSPAFLIGVGLSAFVFAQTDLHSEDWVGAAHESLFSATFPLFAGTFVAATYIGSRDLLPMHTALADTTPVTAQQRTLARLLGGLAPVAVIALLAALAALRVELADGIILGSTRRSLVSAELLLVVLLSALAVATAIAAVQLVRSRAVVAIAGVIVLFLTTAMYWVFGTTILRDLSPALFGTKRVNIPPSVLLDQTPSHWVLDPPDRYQQHWQRVVFDQASVALHGLYVAGLTVFVAALACRAGRHNRPATRVAIVGVALAATGGLLQFTVRTGAWV
jgi:hypothetical protein